MRRYRQGRILISRLWLAPLSLNPGNQNLHLDGKQLGSNPKVKNNSYPTCAGFFFEEETETRRKLDTFASVGMCNLHGEGL